MIAQQKPSYTQVKNHYDTLRETARGIAYEQLPSTLLNKQGALILKNTITLDGLTFNCQKELRKWEKTSLRRVTWDWSMVLKKYCSHPKRFELSIWHKNLFLCGATIGKPTWSGSKLRLDFIEASPIRSPLSGLIVDLTIIAGAAYAETIGATQLRIMHPVNDNVKNLYLSKQGFAYNRCEDFCYRNL